MWPKEVIHCKTEEEANAICKLMHEAWLKWSSWGSYLEKSNYEKRKGEWICYRPKGWRYYELSYCKYNWLVVRSASGFIEPIWPKRWDRVLVRDHESRKRDKAIYLTTIHWAHYPIVCVDGGYEEEYKDGNRFITSGRRHMKPLEETKKLTMQELEKELGYRVEIVE